MGSKIINFKDLKVEHPNRYKVTDSNGTEDIKKIDFDPGLIYQQGTPESAENFNNIQKNCIYEVAGVRILEGQEEIYDISIDGFNNFEFENLKILMTPNATNTIKGSFVRLNGAKYIIKNRTDSIGVGQIFSGESVFISLHFTRKTADVIATLNGGYVGTLAELEKKVNSDLTLHKNDENNPHTVTKAQVGLSNVYNYTATGAVNDPADDKYATAGAVKKAYDKGVEGVEKADSAQTQANEAVDDAQNALNVANTKVRLTPEAKEGFRNAVDIVDCRSYDTVTNILDSGKGLSYCFKRGEVGADKPINSGAYGLLTLSQWVDSSGGSITQIANQGGLLLVRGVDKSSKTATDWKSVVTGGSGDAVTERGMIEPLRIPNSQDMNLLGSGFWGTYGDAYANTLKNRPFSELGARSSFGMMSFNYSPITPGGVNAGPELKTQLAMSSYTGEIQKRVATENSWNVVYDSKNTAITTVGTGGYFRMPNGMLVQYGTASCGGVDSRINLFTSYKKHFTVGASVVSSGGHYGVFQSRPDGLGAFYCSTGNLVTGAFGAHEIRWFAIGE